MRAHNLQPNDEMIQSKMVVSIFTMKKINKRKKKVILTCTAFSRTEEHIGQINSSSTSPISEKNKEMCQ